MAVKLIANYAKRLGLPGYSSHQFSLCIETELVSLDQVKEESARLYRELQESVDEQIQQTGFVPPHGYGMMNGESNGNGANGHHHQNGNGDSWKCSDAQRDLILKITNERRLDKDQVERQAQAMFGKGVKALNKLEASGLIDEMLERSSRDDRVGGESRQRFARRGR